MKVFNIDKNGSLNYHTVHKNDENLLQKCWFCHSHVSCLKGDYDLHNRPTTQAIGTIVKKFEETGLPIDIEKPVHHRFVRSAEHIAIVSESVGEDSNVSILVVLRS